MHEQQVSFISGLDNQTENFHRRFVRIAAISVGSASAVVGVLFALTHDIIMPIAVAVALVVCVAAYYLTMRHHHRTGAYVFLYGYAVVVGATATLRTQAFSVRAAPCVFMLLIPLTGFLLGKRAASVLGVLSIAMMSLVYYTNGVALHDKVAEAAVTAIFVCLLIGVEAFAVRLFVGRAGENLDLLRARLGDIDRVVGRARRIAERDLSGDIAGESDVSDVVRGMLTSLRELVGQIRETAGSLASSTAEISAMARQQEQGAVEQASAVEEIRQTLESLVGASRNIADAAQGVVTNAESTLNNNEVIAERITMLTAHTRRITEILEIIKDIANKSELLALNASLEGAKAGEAGRGFSLVAAQMQRLAENVMESVKDVKALTGDIRDATSTTVVSTEEGTKLASDTTEAARQISIITQQQRSSTEQVTRAMDDISQVAGQVASGSSQTLVAAKDLAGLSERLNTLVQSFQL